MPARKAPKASDKPASPVSHASPSVINDTFNTNSSEDFCRATSVNQWRINGSADDQQEEQHETGFGQCNQQFARHGLAALAERRIQNEQGHDSEVLEQFGASRF